MGHSTTHKYPRRYKPPGDITEVVGLLERALESGDPHIIANAIGEVGRAYGMRRLAAEMGFNYGQVYRTFGPKGNPTLSTLLRALHVLGLRLKVELAPDESKPVCS